MTTFTSVAQAKAELRSVERKIEAVQGQINIITRFTKYGRLSASKREELKSYRKRYNELDEQRRGIRRAIQAV